MKRQKFNRVDFLKALQEYLGTDNEPLVGFSDRDGFDNSVHLYCKNPDMMSDKVSEMMRVIGNRIKTPVMIFIDPLNSVKGIAYTCKEWLDT